MRFLGVVALWSFAIIGFVALCVIAFWAWCVRVVNRAFHSEGG